MKLSLTLILIFIIRSYCIYKKSRIDFKDKSILIFGGSEGIGYEVAKQFIEEGISNLVIISRNKDKLLKAVDDLISSKKCENIKDIVIYDNIHYQDCICSKELLFSNGNYLTIQAWSVDITNDDSINNIIEAYPLARVIINSVGSAQVNYFQDLPKCSFIEHMNKNFFPTISILQKIISERNKNKQFQPLNYVAVASAAACTSFVGYSGYAPSKYALRALCEAVRNECSGTSLTIQLYYPPDTNTPGYMKENISKPEETNSIPASIFSVTPVAKYLIDGIRLNHNNIKGPDILQNFLVNSTLSTQPMMISYIVDIVFYPFIRLAMNIVRLILDNSMKNSTRARELYGPLY